MYITDLKAISPQSTFNDDFYNGKITVHSGNKYFAQEPDYTNIISPILLRRMGKSIRIGIGAAMPLIQRNSDINGIIVGSSEGGLEDCIKFLNQIITYDEGTLSPTNFVQSTPNALAGNIALLTQNTCYNMTHVHKGHAFENALLDAFLLCKEVEPQTILVGNVEEISDYNFNIETLNNHYKKEETTSETLLNSKTKGTVCGEASCMFIMKNNTEEYLAKVIDIDMITYPTDAELNSLILSVLERNNLKLTDIDILIEGRNGDIETENWYNSLNNNLFKNIETISFKHLSGEFPTASAFGLYLGVNAIANKLHYNKKSPKYILIYNHYKGVQHSVTLIGK